MQELFCETIKCDLHVTYYGMLHVPHQSLGPTMSLKDGLGNYDDDIDEIGFKDEKLTTLDVINPCG